MKNHILIEGNKFQLLNERFCSSPNSMCAQGNSVGAKFYMSFWYIKEKRELGRYLLSFSLIEGMPISKNYWSSYFGHMRNKMVSYSSRALLICSAALATSPINFLNI